MTHELRIATRQSPLAMWQAEHVKTTLEQCWPGLVVRLIPMITSGDRFLSDSLATQGGKGMFVKELERALLTNTADLAVHSLKDVPALLPAGLCLSTFLERESPEDAFISRTTAIHTLPPGALIGTASLRRQALIKHYYPHLDVKILRGNVNSRLAKLAAGDFDAIILAFAGLKRLEKTACITELLPLHQFIPAVGQGVLALETRSDDVQTQHYLQPLNHADTTACVMAERAFNERLGGACHVPVAGHAILTGDQLHLEGLVASVDGKQCLQESMHATRADAIALGQQLADKLLARGAAAILQQSL